MVNTFLPFADYKQVAQSLDDRRLGKQRVEALQILKANLGLTKGWVNHPAAVMWRGYEGHLAVYALTMCSEWKKRGYADSTAQQVIELMKQYNLKPISKPWWLGVDEFHKSHQSNLKRKLPEHYDFDVDDDLPYQWPTQTKTLQTTEEKHAQKREAAAAAREAKRNARRTKGVSRATPTDSV